MDQQFVWLRHEAPHYRTRPSEVIRRQVYVITHRVEEPDDPATLLALIGAGGGQERTLFATDLPRYDADDLGRVLALPLPGDWRRKILGQNAQVAFRLPHLACWAAGRVSAATVAPGHTCPDRGGELA